MSVLLYGPETWKVKAEHVRRLRSFHNRCVRAILRVTKYQQSRNRITSKQLASTFGMEEPIEDKLMAYRLRWLGHLERMEEERLPKKLLFGQLVKKRPCHETKKRWRDGVKLDLCGKLTLHVLTSVN